MAFVELGPLELAHLDNKSKPSKENYMILIQEDGQRKEASLPYPHGNNMPRCLELLDFKMQQEILQEQLHWKICIRQLGHNLDGINSFLQLFMARPYVALSSRTTGTGSSSNSTYSELSVTPYVDLHRAGSSTYSSLAGPLKVVTPAAGRRRMCRWHWSNADQSALFGHTSVVNLLYWDTELVDDAKACTNIYIDVNVCGLGKPADSVTELKPMDKVSIYHLLGHVISEQVQ